MSDYVEAWKYFEQYQMFPTPNVGYAEQSALFLNVVDIMSTIKNYIGRRNDEKREKSRTLTNG